MDDDLRKYLEGMEKSIVDSLLEAMRKMQTELLTGMTNFQVANERRDSTHESRYRTQESRLGTLDERMAEAERRLREIETKLIQPPQ